jgi:quaternary ammonium compound-resistance protein SugE
MKPLAGWTFLLASSILQVGWIEALNRTEGFRRPVPILWYAFFGLTSTFTLARSLEVLPVGVAYAAWTGLSVAGSALFELAVGRTSPSLVRGLCLLAILLGTAGLRVASASR